MLIIKPPKKKRLPDPHIPPVLGTRGRCTLCQSYEKLTDAHVPPQSVGNTEEWVTHSYMTALSKGGRGAYFPRHFRGGLSFKTLCHDCNSRLGGREDVALADFFVRVRRILESPVFLGVRPRIVAKPNLIFRGLLAHMVSANEDGRPSTFDTEAREIFFRKRPLNQSSWNLFYWLYGGDALFIQRHAYHVMWSPVVKVREIHLLKLYPIAFMFSQESHFLGLPNIRKFLCRQDDAEVEVPMVMWPDSDPLWPAITSSQNIIMLGGNSFGLVGERG